MQPPKLQEHLKAIEPSPTLMMHECSAQLMAGGKDVVRFGFGQSPFPIPGHVVRALQAHAHEKNYLPVRGLPALQISVAKHLSGSTGHSYTQNNIIVGPGSKELIYLVQMATDGDLLLPSPSWVTYAPQAHMTHKNVHWIDCGPSWKLSPDHLDTYCEQHEVRSPLLILNYPNNPTGLTYNAEELTSLAEVCRKHGIWVLSDEIYGMLAFDGKYKSIASYYPEGTIITTGLSKWCGAGGWRLGILALPDTLTDLSSVIANLASETYSAVSAPIQYAAAVAYTDSDKINTYLQKSRHILLQVAQYCHRELTAAGIMTTQAEGGFYCLVNFENFRPALMEMGLSSGEELCLDLLENHLVALLPGSAFGRPAHEMTARLAFVDFDGKAALALFTTHREFTENDIQLAFPNIWKGINRLTSFARELTLFNTKTLKYESQKQPV